MSKYADADAIEEHIGRVVPMTRAKPREVTEAELAAMGAGEAGDGVVAPSEEFPAELLEVPGLVGHITRFIVKTALFPQPLLALGAALTIVGTASGRKFSGPTNSGTHLYVLGLADTGAGKNHPAKMAKRIMRKADMGDLIGPGQFMSEPAVYQHIAARPLLLCFMDEFGSYLQRINNPKGSSGYEKAISGALRIFWGASFDTVHPPAWAESSSRKEVKPVTSPALSIYGMSVHEEFYAALQSADVANGFLNRFLVLSTHTKPEEVDPELRDDEIPSVLTDWLQDIAATRYNARAPVVVDSWKAEIHVDWACADARLAYKAFRRSVEDRAADSKLLSRVPEMAVRLATIRAIGRVKTATPMVDVEDFTWGAQVALWSAERMIADAASYMVESDHQGRANEVLRHIKAARGGKLTLTELSRKVKHKYDARALRLILEGLRDTEQVEVVRVQNAGAGRPSDVIIFKG